MKMNFKHAVAFLIAVLAITMLTGCPQTVILPGELLSAKEAWEIIKPAQETLPEDAVPVYIEGTVYYPGYPIENGMTYVWEIGFYSESESKVWEVRNYSDQAVSDPNLGHSSAEERYTDVSLTVNDLADWNVDSPEACEIAAQNGAGETDGMSLRIASSDNDNIPFKVYEFIPESTKLFWVIKSGSYRYYIDACTGEYLGKYTSIQLINMN